jgi:hypothetical protein
MICQGRVADAAAGEEEHGEHDDVVDVGADEDAGGPPAAPRPAGPSSTWSSSCYVLAGILYEVELVAGEQHGAAVAGPLPQGFRQADHGHRVQAAERLVEGDDRRVMHQGR